MLEAYDRGLVKRAVLENAYNRVETERLNGVGTYTFSLPGDDGKAADCAPFGFLRDGEGDYYRLLADGEREGDTGERTFEAEHAIATLVDDVLFGTHIVGGLGLRTRDVLTYILSKQTVKHWTLGACEFDKQFEYGWESENLLNALFSVPNLFEEPYMWAYDMRAYPWKISLLRLDEGRAARFHIRAGKNLIASRASRTGADVCTRLYLLGYGEGDNQLTIREANGGVPYLQSPREYIDRYGLISKVYVDRQFEDAPSLKARGQALLRAMQEPRYARTFEVADLYAITKQDYDDARCGDTVRLEMDGTLTYVTGVRRRLDIDGDMTIEMATTPRDLAADIADIADRQRIEQVYAQGATQIYAQSVQANATKTTQAVLNFHIPKEMRIVNKVLAKISLEPFRGYSRVTSGGGRSTQTSSAGGGVTVTSSAGGGSTLTTTAGGQTTLSATKTVTLEGGVGYTTDVSSLVVTEGLHPSYGTITGPATGQTGAASCIATGSASGGSTGAAGGVTGVASSSMTYAANGAVGAHSHGMAHTHGLGGHTHSAPTHTHSMPHTHGQNAHTHPIGAHKHYMAHTHTIYHKHTIPGHTHNLPQHGHQVVVPAHTHNASVPAHTHGLNTPDHTHEIVQGIFRSGDPRRATVYVGGRERFAMGKDIEVDLTPHLLNSAGKIPRGSWIRLGVLPDDLAYVTIDLIVQGFVQSRGGGTY